LHIINLKMNDRIKKILGKFHPEKLKNDKRIIVFAICLFIAAALWFLNALGRDYTATLSYSVKYVNPPDKLFLANEPPDKFELTVQAHGFTLLRHKLAFSFSPIVLDLKNISQNLDNQTKEVQISTENLLRQIGEQVSKEIAIVEISPKNIALVFDNHYTKMVPVKPRVSLNFKPQFYLRGDIAVKPESLKITGPSAIIDTISFLQTENKTFQNLDKNLENVILVEHPSATKISPEKVTLNIPVEKFTEKKISVPVQLINMPQETRLKLFPAAVTVTFLVGLSDYENISEKSFNAVADYRQTSSKQETLEVLIVEKPPFVEILKVSPGKVEYLIETAQ
jgi:YbbR domain-containing protein